MSPSTIMREPVDPQRFLRRAMYFSATLAVIQLVHLAVFTNAGPHDFIVWLGVHCVTQLTLFLLRDPARGGERYFQIDWKKLAALFIVALAFKLSSRLPYLSSWLSEGLYATRMNEELGNGGLGSIGSIFFYPAAILLPFTSMPRRLYRWLLAGLLLVCAIDFVALGTRNAPMFVLMFHLLSVRTRFGRKHLLTGLAGIVLLVAVFGYSTSNRTQESSEGQFDWLVLFEYTGSTEIVKINHATVEPIAKYLPGALPAIFLSHYVAHSIGELRNLIQLSPELPLGGVYYLKDQFCAIGLCDRGQSLEAIELANPRPGVYQTLWASLLLDFGWAGAVLVYALAVASVATVQLLKPRTLGIGTIFLSMIICLGPIENYFYNGLGLVQGLCVFLAYWIARFSFKSLFVGAAAGAAPTAHPQSPAKK